VAGGERWGNVVCGARARALRVCVCVCVCVWCVYRVCGCEGVYLRRVCDWDVCVWRYNLCL